MILRRKVCKKRQPWASCFIHIIHSSLFVAYCSQMGRKDVLEASWIKKQQCCGYEGDAWGPCQKKRSLKMNVCIVTYFICFTIVLLPDSPAPVGRLKMEFRLESMTKEPAATEQNNREEDKKVNTKVVQVRLKKRKHNCCLKSLLLLFPCLDSVTGLKPSHNLEPTLPASISPARRWRTRRGHRCGPPLKLSAWIIFTPIWHFLRGSGAQQRDGCKSRAHRSVADRREKEMQTLELFFPLKWRKM